ncbi:hypothetical protein PYCCODRAFT_1460750 [Trametes coccinea BRFM310]|uniref:Uncharacterized protein n=1 Tax=Trametes coccinea (strain BRFM310) TaxID=1353009 RepID=A0A1Y2IHZ4_TRAC3|nr:hypothetical protein PYCCODRAFT_1460750 [Trametes coccinea BRFM310]
MRYHLVVAHYTRDKLPGRHWALAAVTRGNPWAEVYQIIGNTDSYGLEIKTVQLLRSGSLRGGFEVGEMDESQLDWLKDTLSKVEIKHNDPNWHCQSWVIDAVRELRQPEHSDKITIRPGITMQRIHDELAAEEENWEMGETTFLESLVNARG